MSHSRNVILFSLLFAMSSLFFIKGVVGSAILQPAIYVFLLLGSIFLFQPRSIKENSILLSLSIFLILLLVIQSRLIGLHYGIINEVGRVVYPFLATFIMISIFDTAIKNKRLFLKYFVIIVTILLCLDLAFRLMQSGMIFPTSNRYQLKVGGLIFIDSNFNGFLAACLLLFVLFQNQIKFDSKLTFTLFFLALYSFSLAVYIGLFLVLLWKIVMRYKILLPFMFAAFVGLVLYVYFLVEDDGSFQTKLEIFYFFIETYLSMPASSILFGIGSGNFIEYTGRAAHSLFGLFTELGSLFVVVFLYFIYRALLNKETYVVLLFVGIVGFASIYPITYMTLIYFVLMAYKRLDIEEII